jgi:valine--pyruvate aminotransferase
LNQTVWREEREELAMGMSFYGSRMAAMSGLRAIMDDVAVVQAVGPGERWLNLGVGNPALIPEAVAMWRRLATQTLATDFEAASCQYGPSRGAAPLVDAIRDYFGTAYGWDLAPENVVVGPGSQMLCFIAAALFTGPGAGGLKRLVLPCVPDYAGYQGISMDGGVVGVAPRLELHERRQFRYLLDHEALRERADAGLLLLSSPSNPAGRSADADDLRNLVEMTDAREAVLVIDNAYGEPFPRVSQTLAPPVWHPNVINCFSMSKAGMPGERLGFAIGAARHISAMVSFIANVALHAPQFPQMILARALRTDQLGDLAASVIQPYYLERRATAEKLLAEYLPGDVDWRLHAGRGGMFCWLWINEPWFDDAEFYQLLKNQKVVIVPGRHFFPDPHCLRQHGTQCIRLSITPDEAVVSEGIQIIARALADLASR